MRIQFISFTLLSFLMLIQGVTAQEIDPSWYYRSGVTFTQEHTFDPDQTLFDLQTFGTDQVWDFSNEPFSNLVDTTWFLEPSEMVFSENYPNATVGRRNISPFFDWEWYYRIENDTIYDEGESFIKTFGTTQDTVILTLPNLNIVHMQPFLKINERFFDLEPVPAKTVFFQGFGTVINSEQDTFPNCILLKSEYSFDGYVDYRWYQSDLTKEVAVFSNSGPSPELTRLKDYFDESITSTSDIPIERMEALTFSYDAGYLLIHNSEDVANLQIQVFDISGRKLHSSSNSILTGTNKVKLALDQGLGNMVVLCIDQDSGAFQCEQVICR